MKKVICSHAGSVDACGGVIADSSPCPHSVEHSAQGCTARIRCGWLGKYCKCVEVEDEKGNL